MLADSFTFGLSSLAPLKEKKRKLRLLKYRAISKTSINGVFSVNVQIVYNVLKIVKTNIRKQKFQFLLYIPSLYFNTMISKRSPKVMEVFKLKILGSFLFENVAR